MTYATIMSWPHFQVLHRAPVDLRGLPCTPPLLPHPIWTPQISFYAFSAGGSGGIGLKAKFQWKLMPAFSALNAANRTKNQHKMVAIGIEMACPGSDNSGSETNVQGAVAISGSIIPALLSVITMAFFSDEVVL